MKLFKNFFKPTTPTVEFWTSVSGLSAVPECIPRPAGQLLPQWLKTMPTKNMHERSSKNIKHCPVIPEFLTQGYIVPMWCDTILRVGNSDADWSWNTASDEFRWEIHSDDQLINHIPEHSKDRLVFKAVSPWYVKTPPGYSVYQMPLFYHFNRDFDILPGSIRTDMYYEINQQVMVKHNSEIFIPRGTPFAWYIPYKRNKYELIVSEENEEKKKMHRASILNVLTKFTGGYKSMARELDRKGN
jgi:hypothetical protein